jgi:hypothetical protein
MSCAEVEEGLKIEGVEEGSPPELKVEALQTRVKTKGSATNLA